MKRLTSFSDGLLGGETMTAKDELWALALLLILAALLYLATWFAEGTPFSQEEPTTIVSYLQACASVEPVA
jgi:hypothetical protein